MGRNVFAFLFLMLLGIAQLGFCGSCIESEKQALLKFKASIHDDPYNNLSPWNPKNLSSWNPETNCCKWDGIACHNVTGHVLTLDLRGYHLEANGIDPSLLELRHLIHLDLSWNDFNGTSIPLFLGSMERLRYLSIYYANFTGKIPSNFGGNLTNLQFLDLSWNYDLHINDMSWASKLESLQYLNLSHVYLGEAHNLFQVLHMLPSLLELQLERCGLGNLSVPLPPINFTNNVGVQILNLAVNEIDGRILTAFQNWTSVEFLDLTYNNISSLPLWFGEFRNLISLGLSINAFCGPIPIALRNLTSLRDLYLSDNNFSSVPSWLGEFRKLISLGLSGNALSGPIPTALRNLTSLQDLDLSGNNFSSIPSWLGELRSLHQLYISYNQITATMEISVSQILRNMCHLQILDFRNSNLQGEAFGDSDFSGCVKYDTEQLTLGNNKLNGHISTWVAHLEKLQLLDLSNNLFSGNIPQSLGQLVNLISFDLSNNSFSGSIPPRLCHLVNLTRIDLSRNNFSSEIPNCWRDNHPYGLSEINFSFNKLSSAFPISIGNLSSLLWLHLNNNNLEGKLPLTLNNLKQLRILDLGENTFFGSIPSSWTNNTFPTLQILRLRDNLLDGNIPLNMCQLKSLQILDLANNKLSGSIPHCIGNLKGMTKDSGTILNSTIQLITPRGISMEKEWSEQDIVQVMKGREFDIIRILQLEVNLDLSDNNLVGSIPLEVFSLIGLIGLNLSHNHLKGEILEIIENMKSLESFDISHNQISGAIPKSMSKLTALNYLNMSYNNLSGPIPTENQFLTLNDPSIYAGNPYLCGIPLSNKCQGVDTHQVQETKELEDENDSEKVWFYFVIAAGFVVGFWGAIGTLVLKKTWRYACFRRVEDVADEIYVFTSIKLAKLKRLFTNHVHG